MDDPTIVEVKGTRSSGDAPMLFGRRYRPVALLGTGGMGSVYLTRDVELDELVAAKVLKPELLSDPSMLERFRDEVRLARRVSSPFVARTHDLAEHEGRWFVTMQYVEGETLSTKLRREGRLALGDIVPIARDLCAGLTAVHTANIVHRDLKPANVLIKAGGGAVITDFGIALRAESALTMTDGFGTPTYTAPEQLAGGSVDARADIYALGAILYVMSTGQKPFPGVRTGLETPPNPSRVAADVPEAFAAIVMRAMALDPRQRYPSSDALRAAIDALRPAASTGPVTRPSLLPSFVRSLGAGVARRLSVSMALEGIAPPLGNAVRVDLVSRLNARGQLRVVRDAADAEAALDARVVAQGDNYRLDLALRSKGDGYEFWTETLQGPLSALPQLIERAAHAIECAFSPTSTPMRETGSFPSADVARYFLEGRAEYRAFWGDHMKRSVELFEAARALAPDHPLVLAWCAAAHSRQRFFGATPEHDAGHEFALRAVELAPDIPDAHIALAASHTLEMRMVEAMPHFVEALRIAPGLMEHRANFARVLSECGAVEPARALASSTFEADPTFGEPLEVIMRLEALHGRMDRAAAELTRAPLERDSFVRVAFLRFCFWARDRELFETQRARLDAARIDPLPRAIMEMYRTLLSGERPPLEHLAIAGGPRRRSLYHQMRAEMFAFMGDEALALDELERSLDAGLFDVQWLDLCALFDPLRGTIRFETVRHTAHQRAMAVLSEIERCLAT
jgi:tetratricopeptide (TPR) repeat protein